MVKLAKSVKKNFGKPKLDNTITVADWNMLVHGQLGTLLETPNGLINRSQLNCARLEARIEQGKRPFSWIYNLKILDWFKANSLSLKIKRTSYDVQASQLYE